MRNKVEIPLVKPRGCCCGGDVTKSEGAGCGAMSGGVYPLSPLGPLFDNEVVFEVVAIVPGVGGARVVPSDEPASFGRSFPCPRFHLAPFDPTLPGEDGILFLLVAVAVGVHQTVVRLASID